MNDPLAFTSLEFALGGSILVALVASVIVVTLAVRHRIGFSAAAVAVLVAWVVPFLGPFLVLGLCVSVHTRDSSRKAFAA